MFLVVLGVEVNWLFPSLFVPAIERRSLADVYIQREIKGFPPQNIRWLASYFTLSLTTNIFNCIGMSRSRALF
jgi:hypothetical protein